MVSLRSHECYLSLAHCKLSDSISGDVSRGLARKNDTIFFVIGSKVCWRYCI
jgi:hypothetical protein